MSQLNRWMPGLTQFREYRREWLPHDIVAGLSVAAVAIPIAIAYSQIAGVPPQIAIYAAIFAPLAYAVFGTSRQLIINPDSAVSAILASTLAPLAAVGSDRYVDLCVALTAVVGVVAIVGGVLRLGVIANFLSRPILIGYMNGIAASILVGQLGGLTGLRLQSDAFGARLLEVIRRLPDASVPTLALGLALFALLRVLKRAAPWSPAPLIVCIVGIAATMAWGLDGQGVALVGAVPAGFAPLRLPDVMASDIPQLLAGGCSMALVSYCSMMPTARSFAARHGYTVDGSQEFIALGAANFASGLGHGFVVSGADSRTAVGEAAGGKTQLTGIVASATMAVALLFLTGPLALLPATALSAIVISAVVGMFDLKSPLRYYRIHPVEGLMCVVATVGVIALGLLPGLLAALVIGFIRLLMLTSHPHDAVLGIVETGTGVHATEEAEGQRVPGLVIYGFDASLLFFNADYFKERVRAAVAAESTRVEWVVLDAESMPLVDITGAEVLDDLRRELEAQGMVLAIARARGWFLRSLERTGLRAAIGERHVFPTVRAAVEAFRRRPPA